MSEEKNYDFLAGNRITYYVFLSIMFLVMEVYKNGWNNIDYLGFIVSTTVALLVLNGLNWGVKKFNMWLEAKRDIKKAALRK